jgi:glycosyltransferase involved in cell wall biosynthesis
LKPLPTLSSLASWWVARSGGPSGAQTICSPLHEPGSVRQLLVDVSVIYQRDAGTGIQRVVRGLLLQLQRSMPVGYVLAPVFATRTTGYAYAEGYFLGDSTSVRSDCAAEVQVAAEDIFLGLDLAAHLLPRHERQISVWKQHGVAIHLMVYDLLPLAQPGWFKRRTCRNFRRWLGFLARQADGAICISEDVREKLRRWLGSTHPAAAQRIQLTTIRLGGDIRATAPSFGVPEGFDALMAALGQVHPVLMVGTIEPRKGYDRALAAFERIWSEHPQSSAALVVVGKPGWKTERLQRRLRTHPEQGRRLFWLDEASDELLGSLYGSCVGVLVTSHGEGYGLPVTEAAWLGKRVLARDLRVFQEIGHPEITFFRDDSPRALAAAIGFWLKADASGEKMALGSADAWSVSLGDLLRSLNLVSRAAPDRDPGSDFVDRRQARA